MVCAQKEKTMYTIHKLKPDRNFYPLLLPFFIFVVAALFWVLIGIDAAIISLAIIWGLYATYSLMMVWRTHNLAFIISALFQASAGLLTWSITIFRHDPSQKALTLLFLACEIFFMVWLILLAVNRKIKWRGRDVLELAARAVDEIGNGYTSRPLHAGKTEFTQQQLRDFAEFARRNLIAFAYLGQDNIVFVPVMLGREVPYMLGLKNDYLDDTWVAFDAEGDISVNISHRDYLEYKEALAFNQLCDALGNLFVEFIELHQRGESVRIIDRLDSAGVSIFS
jgi:hypothetical protein